MTTLDTALELAKEKLAWIQTVRIPEARASNASVQEIRLLLHAAEYFAVTISEYEPHGLDAMLERPWIDRGVLLDNPQEIEKDGQYFNGIGSRLLQLADRMKAYRR